MLPLLHRTEEATFHGLKQWQAVRHIKPILIDVCPNIATQTGIAQREAESLQGTSKNPILT